jgi:hypothetical protein
MGATIPAGRCRHGRFGPARFVMPAAYARSMQLTATIRTRPEPGATNRDGLAMDVITTTADDYDTAYAALAQRVPEGWQMLSVRGH